MNDRSAMAGCRAFTLVELLVAIVSVIGTFWPLPRMLPSRVIDCPSDAAKPTSEKLLSGALSDRKSLSGHPGRWPGV
ncbi:MAG: type II secretion system protein [Chthoniobacterales bacterium]|nr:type II secretion system protein [Chthoniobacterales bacterium]